MENPKWVDEILEKYRSAVAVGFVLHLNVNDYVVPGVTLKSYLAQVLADRKCIAFYNRAEGITFPLPAMEEAFRELTGWEADPLDPEPPKEPNRALPLLEKLLKAKDEGGKASAVIIDYTEALIPAADLATMIPDDRTTLVNISRWARDPEIVSQGNPVFLITANLADLHSSIRAASSKYEMVRIPIPDYETRLAFINAQDGLESDLDKEEIAKATAGLSMIHIEDIYLRAKEEGRLTWDLIRDRKRDIIRSEFGEVLEIMEPRYGFEAVGGLEKVKDFFMRSIVVPVKRGNYDRVPMGVLMTGPAGTGKTIMAEAVAKESGVNMAILNPAKIFSKWVGESERNLEKALECVKSLAPTIVFIDEIDQSLRRGEEGDSGVSNRVFKRLMEFMSDTPHRGQVVFLAATNRPDLMDAALKRPGRFDNKIPFFVPDPQGRGDILKVMCKRYGVGISTVKDAWLRITEGWTGAELERLVIKAKGMEEDFGLDPALALDRALELVRARTQDIEFMTQIAIDECDDLEFLPEEYRGKAREAVKFQRGDDQDV